MITIKKLLIIISVGVITFSCQFRQVQRSADFSAVSLPESLPDSLWVSQNLVNRMDSLKSYYLDAQQKLSEGDTIGAQIYFDQAFDQLSELTDEDRNTLSYWSELDSVVQLMDRQYQKIYLKEEPELEAEEVREDITKLEELNFPDSVLFGEGTVIDTSGPLPITINNKVRLAIKYFQTKGRYIFSKWLKRSGRYEKIIKPVLREEGVPEDLFYLAMIESGFQPRARSYARAVGIWQFISATGRFYGLRHNWWFDERRDIFKSTRAAAQHLYHLYERFGDWYLAMAGYNCNPKKVERNIRRYRTRDFWKLRRLPRQTKNYIPTFLAATIIARNPEKFGFYIEKDPPFEVDSVIISESVDLNVIAKIVDTTYQFIREINPAVLRWVTPPGIKDFVLYLPKGTKERFKIEYAKIPDHKKRSWVRHRIRSGETLSTIARKYRTSVSVIKSINKIRGNLIRAGRYLLIPVPQNKAHYYASIKKTTYSRSRRTSKRKIAKITNVPGARKVIYVVKPGDTIGEIAEKYNTRASYIRRWNGLRYGDFIYPKQKLVIWARENFASAEKINRRQLDDSATYYTVKTGDTLWDISKKYGLSIEELKRLNNMHSVRIRPGDRLKVSKN
ncbi:MAG: LysM peptidoglycan-binding domain-containing protein [Calditrichaeota bacterium]|nr:LysM peptidoglycan-binding domain-containing protein [Calditrichota bacterium]